MYINNFENNINSNNNINNSNNINNNIYNSNSNNIPIFWAIITTQKLRFIYLSPSLKSLIYKKDNNLNFLIGSSIYDYISQNDIKQIKFHIHSYINSGEFIDKKFRYFFFFFFFFFFFWFWFWFFYYYYYYYYNI